MSIAQRLPQQEAQAESQKPRVRLLQAASRLFYAEGIRGVGVDRIAEQANVTKATLYRIFESKENLTVEYLRERHQDAISTLRASADDQATPRERALAAFDALRHKASDPSFRGCAFVMAVGEHPESMSIGEVAREHKQAVRAHFKDVLAPTSLAPSLADYLALLYDGALARVAIERCPTPVDIARACAAQLLDGLPHQ
ncbi:MAG: TetR/AcrR family transcriptional regulator [Xenophilus sp.]